MIDTKSIFKPTHDDWYGNFPNNEVNLRYHPANPRAPEQFCRVSVWGTDDHAMIFDTPNEGEAKKMFNDLAEAEFIDKEHLDRLGFVVF
jgi:hypothetical protein